MFTARGMKKQTVMHSRGEILFTNKKEGVKKKVRKESIRVCVLATFVMKIQVREEVGISNYNTLALGLGSASTVIHFLK